MISIPNKMNSRLSSNGGALFGGFKFNPKSLFLGGAAGALYSLQDIGTLFQDSAGTTPVTSAGDPVGLVYDVSQGLTEGADIVTNGIFASDTGWDKGAGWSIGSGVATRTNTGGATNLEQLSFPVSDNVFYLVSYEITAYTSGSIRSAFTGGSASVGAFKTSTGVYTELIFSDAGNDVLAFQASSTFAGSIDNVSVKSLAGNHAIQATAGSRPTYQVDARGYAYLDFDGTDDYLTIPGSDSALKFMHDGTGGTFIGAYNIDTVVAVCALYGSRTNNLSIGAKAQHANSASEEAFESQVSNGSANVIAAVGASNSFASASPHVIHTQYITQASDDFYGYVDGVEVATDTDTGVPSTSNSTYDMQIGADGNNLLPMNGKWYGNAFIGAILTPQQAFELTRYYAQISGVTL